MNILRRAIRKLIHILGRWRLLSPPLTARLLSAVETGHHPRLNPPRDLNEKLMWLAFNTDTSLWSQLADKAEARAFVSKRGFADILVPLIGVYDSPDDIDFESLPPKFVIKTTNGSAQTLMVYDKSKLDTYAVKKKMRLWLQRPFGYETGESHYTRIRPRIIVEQMLPLGQEEFLTDYKFMCFDGRVHSCLVCSDRDSRDLHCKTNLFDIDTWQEIPGSSTESYRGDAAKIRRPSRLEDMVRIASRLSKGFPFVRVDLYEARGKIYFGELTFTPAAFRIAYLSRPTLLSLGENVKMP